MNPENPPPEDVLAEMAALRARLENAEEALRAIRSGEVDALVVEAAAGPQIFTLQGLEAESNRFRGDILAQISDSVVAVDGEERVTYLNAAAEKQYGVRTTDALGQPLHVLWTSRWFRDDDESSSIGLLRETGSWRGESIHITRGGAEIYVESSVIQLRDANGAANGFLATIRDITDRKLSEEKLAMSARQLRLITDIAPVLIAQCDRDHRYKFVNEPYAARLGLRRQQVLGKRIPEVVGEAAYASIYPYLERVLTGEALEFEISLPSGKLGAHFMRCAYAPEHDASGKIVGLVAAIMDITRQKHAEETLRQNAGLFATLIDHAPVGVYVIDAQFRLQQVNPLALPAFANVRPLVGRDFSEVMQILWGSELASQILGIFRHTLETGERYISPQFFQQRIDLGEERAYDWEAQRVTLPDGQDGVVCYFTDVTERHRFEVALQQAKDAAETANQSKDRFLAVLSHELRTPLTPVLMTLAALEHDPQLRADLREDLTMMKRNIELETKLIDDLLDLSRITTGKLELALEAVDLNQAVQQVCGICRSQLMERGIHLEVDLDDSVPVAVDPARFQQVLWNVLKNAIKFTPEKGAIRVTTKRLAGDRCEVRVRDSGIGIPAEVLPRIFDAFEQGDASVTRQFGGLGLGLAICKALVELHRGTIRAESTGPSHGSTFVIELPVGAFAAIEKSSDATPAQNGKSAQLTLLLVEDHPDTARTLSRLLRRAGFAVITASDVASACAAAEREPFDLLISDLGLPDGSGYEIMRRVRETRSVPGIAMSGYGMEADVRRSHEAGFTEHLVKPVDVPELVAAIRRVADGRRA